VADLWYAAYGSNLARDRFENYLSGGRPVGATRHYPGARDSSPPIDDRPLLLPGRLFFAWESPTWGGGIAFYDPPARTGSPPSSSPISPPRRCAAPRVSSST
jgi:hypothetical protein